MTEDTGPATARTGRLHRWFDVRFRSATAIYGLIVFTSFITIASDEVTEDGHPIDAFELLMDAAPALIVFYAAHVFAHTLTDHGAQGFARAFRHALVHSSGMLWSAVPTILILITGAATHLSGADAYWYSMLAAIVVLTVLGYAAYSRRGVAVPLRVLGGIGTGALGFLLIMLEYALH
ncbi:hypothetical protein [Microbacterium sp. SORGH_AS_0888]|uniref:hypothetical protein n=1 Tax=Microbacterium sp. SORGH_AS_0888 TaxID=3041791 RepID=UPI00278832CD|nr:hypothetical protein [Microbacterium sp. SORGH_AS_0888]MDQ1128052.1 hypothetical protein [Microbacterium sp. SORGH_AS_0888]